MWLTRISKHLWTLKNCWYFTVLLGYLVRRHYSVALSKTVSLYFNTTVAFSLWPSCLCFLNIEITGICYSTLYKTWFLHVLIHNIKGDAIGCNFHQLLLEEENYHRAEGSHAFLLNKDLLTTKKKTQANTFLSLFF